MDKSGNRKKGGSGLGLSIVKHVLEAHNEKIFVVTEGEFVDKDQEIKILSVDGNRVVVRINN